MSNGLGTYTFLPWLRHGMTNDIAGVDGQRAFLDIRVRVKARGVGGSAEQTHDVTRRVFLYGPGDIIVRQGDYGSSLFFLIEGRAHVALDHLPQQMLGRAAPPQRGLMRSIAQLWSNHRTVEYRDARKYGSGQTGAAQRGEGKQARVFLQDIPDILDKHRTVILESGSFFGE